MLSKRKQIHLNKSHNNFTESTIHHSKTPVQISQITAATAPGNSVKSTRTLTTSTKSSDVRKVSNGYLQPKDNETISGAGIGIQLARKSNSERSSSTPAQELQLLDGVISNIQNVIISENDRHRQKEVKKLMASLSDWESVDDASLIRLVKQLQKNAEFIDEKFNPLIQQILMGNWVYRSDDVIWHMERLISELIVLRPGFAGTAIFSFVSKFSLPQALYFKGNVDSISTTEEKVFEICHRNLQRILASFPQREENGIKSLSHAYPYMGKATHIHYCYVYNLFKCIDYLPQGRGQVLQVLIHKLARIDVNIPRNDMALSDSPFVLKTEDGQQEIFEMNLDEDCSAMTNPPLNPLIDTLDVCLDMVFQYVDKISRSRHQGKLKGDTGVESPLESEKDWDQLVVWFLEIFEAEILPSFGLNNVQFVYFYIMYLDPTFTLKFMDFLWNKATNLNTSPVLRIQSMAYVSGILARASFISLRVVKNWLTKLCDWSNNYASQRSKSSNWSSVNIQAHGPFYAVCQTIFYVFAFRNKELITNRKCAAFIRSLDLGRLLTCELNPLKACQEEIALAFVDATHHHQISYCGTVLERNQGVKIPTVSQAVIAGLSEPFLSSQLEVFFPFDPFLLPRSRRWIERIYMSYEAYSGDLMSTKTPGDEDSIEMELGSFHERGATARTLRSQSKQDEDMGFIY